VSFKQQNDSSNLFSYHNYYFWIPILAPLIGGPLGVWTYHTFIGAHLPDPDVADASTPSKVVLKNGLGDEELKPLSSD
jgi:hypothetical protein